VAEAQERERLKNMTEEERREWERANPKVRERMCLRAVCMFCVHVLACGCASVCVYVCVR